MIRLFGHKFQHGKCIHCGLPIEFLGHMIFAFLLFIAGVITVVNLWIIGSVM